MHSVVLPAIIRAGSDQAARRFLESFAATLRNKNTRLSYYRVACQVEQQRIRGLAHIEPMHVSFSERIAS